MIPVPYCPFTEFTFEVKPATHWAIAVLPKAIENSSKKNNLRVFFFMFYNLIVVTNCCCPLNWFLKQSFITG